MMMEQNPQRDNLEGLTTKGFGIATSLLNMSCAITPIILAGAESAFGFTNLESIFILLAISTCFASITLWKAGLDS